MCRCVVSISMHIVDLNSHSKLVGLFSFILLAIVFSFIVPGNTSLEGPHNALKL